MDTRTAFVYNPREHSLNSCHGIRAAGKAPIGMPNSAVRPREIIFVNYLQVQDWEENVKESKITMEQLLNQTYTQECNGKFESTGTHYDTHIPNRPAKRAQSRMPTWASTSPLCRPRSVVKQWKCHKPFLLIGSTYLGSVSSYKREEASGGCFPPFAALQLFLCM